MQADKIAHTLGSLQLLKGLWQSIFTLYFPQTLNFLFWGYAILFFTTADFTFTTRHLQLGIGRKATTNLDSILKSRDITLLSKVHLVKAVLLYM